MILGGSPLGGFPKTIIFIPCFFVPSTNRIEGLSAASLMNVRIAVRLVPTRVHPSIPRSPVVTEESFVDKP